MTLPTSGPISIGDVNAEVGVSYTTQHGLDWVFEMTRPNVRPPASGYTPVTIVDPVNGGTIDIADSNLGYYQTSPGTGLTGSGAGWAYYNNNAWNSNCNNGNCPNCGTSGGNISNCANCTTTPINCTVDDAKAWIQPNCNCACSYNCNAITYPRDCNCQCPWICACGW
jgi:hypothetical protein